MSTSKDKYEFWLESPYFDQETKEELKKIRNDEKEIEERFYKDLEFGTAGLRGIIGAGTNRMNIYTVRKATQGLADYISKIDNAKERGVAIAYDSRNKSPEFALEAARVLAGNGIKVYLFDELKPVPELSFTVRKLKCALGIVITASHNPKEYNGYKVYGPDGAQQADHDSIEVLKEINKIDNFEYVKIIDKERAIKEGLLIMIGKDIDDSYIESLKTLQINSDISRRIGKDLKIVYTPLHGTGNKPVRRILDEIGFKNVLVVKEQELPDSSFPTVKSPNPEDRNALKLAIKLAEEQNVDLIIGTDPDCDRVGVVVRKLDGQYAVLTGNQTGCLLLNYILAAKKERNCLPEKSFAVKTIVTTELARTIAGYYGVELVEVLTGFKYIGEKIKILDENGDKSYQFGFEESFGYLAGTFARDKDGVVACMLIAEMTAYYRDKGMTLYEGLQQLYEKFGFAQERVDSFTLEGKAGIEKIQDTMSNLRNEKINTFGSVKASAIRDYYMQVRYDLKNGSKTSLDLPKSNVLYYELDDASWFCIRPSGTEPKIKIYYGVSDKFLENSNKKLDKLQADVLSVVKPLLFESK